MSFIMNKKRNLANNMIDTYNYVHVSNFRIKECKLSIKEHVPGTCVP